MRNLLFVFFLLIILLASSCNQLNDSISHEEAEEVWVPLVRPLEKGEEGYLSTQQSFALSPSGCGAYADRPHKSGTISTEVIAYARVTCRSVVPIINVTGTLSKKNLLGLYVTVSSSKNPRSGTTTNKSYLRIVPAVPCNNGDYRSRTDASVKDIDGKYYYASAVLNFGAVSTC